MSNPEKMYDLVIIGSGPAGLSAAVQAESERINVGVVDNRNYIGGQAATSPLIENIPGFPDGIPGDVFMGRMADQAVGFGTEVFGPSQANILAPTDDGYVVYTSDGGEYQGSYVLISTGVQPRHLNARGVGAYRGRGVSYESPNRLIDYTGKKVIIVGAGNSAGQAAFKLSDVCDVDILVRGEGLEASMSGYLIDKLAKRSNITVRPYTQLEGVDGDGRLSCVTIFDTSTQSRGEEQADEVFILIGSKPHTDWLPEALVRDDRDYVITGSQLTPEAREAFREQTKGRDPQNHETSMPGVFAAGDVRFGNNKRVVLALGEGAAVIPEIHNLRSYKPGNTQS